jgi:hypothetical protein
MPEKYEIIQLQPYGESTFLPEKLVICSETIRSWHCCPYHRIGYQHGSNASLIPVNKSSFKRGILKIRVAGRLTADEINYMLYGPTTTTTATAPELPPDPRAVQWAGGAADPNMLFGLCRVSVEQFPRVEVLLRYVFDRTVFRVIVGPLELLQMIGGSQDELRFAGLLSDVADAIKAGESFSLYPVTTSLVVTVEKNLLVRRLLFPSSEEPLQVDPERIG